MIASIVPSLRKTTVKVSDITVRRGPEGFTVCASDAIRERSGALQKPVHKVMRLLPFKVAQQS